MRIAVVTSMAVALGAVVFAAPSTEATGPATLVQVTSPTELVVGKELYREYCGQCHSFKPAQAAGFGSNNGLGQFGGPSFNNLIVPFTLSVEAVTESFVEHEVVVTKMSWSQLGEVSSYIAQATKRNAYLARISDG